MCEVPNSMNRIEDPEPVETSKSAARVVIPDVPDTIKWISVNDELPCFCETVLIAYRYIYADKNDNGQDVSMGWYDIKEKRWKRSDALKMDAVMYWADRPNFPEQV